MTRTLSKRKRRLDELRGGGEVLKKGTPEFEQFEKEFPTTQAPTTTPEVPTREPEREVIQLREKRSFDIKEFREREGVVANLVKAATDWRTTVALLATLGTLIAAPFIIGAVGAKVGAAAGTGAITGATRAAGLTRLSTGAFGKVVTTSNIPGAFSGAQAGFSGGLATVLTNPKTAALTTKILVGAGLTLGAAALARDIIGTYPFAAFGKEEALQGVGFPLNKALDAGDIEGAQMILDASNEMVNAAPTIADKIPYLNVQKAFAGYVEAQAVANVEWQRLIDERIAESKGKGEFESPFEKSAREREERDIQTKADIEESRRVSEETFQRRQTEIQEATTARTEEFNLAQEARDTEEEEKFAKIEEERTEREKLDTLFFEAIRKRNAGIELTDEEKELLISRGVDPEPIKQTSTFRRKSRVQF